MWLCMELNSFPHTPKSQEWETKLETKIVRRRLLSHPWKHCCLRKGSCGSRKFTKLLLTEGEVQYCSCSQPLHGFCSSRVRTIGTSSVLPTAKISSGKRDSTYGNIQQQITKKDSLCHRETLYHNQQCIYIASCNECPTALHYGKACSHLALVKSWYSDTDLMCQLKLSTKQII